MKASILTSILAVSQALASAIVRRDSGPTCADLTAKSNNGDRKIAIVIDSSGSMTSSDPDDLRLSAGRTINDWLISKSEVVGGKKVDLVTVIDFDSSATLDYPLGDPAGANASFSKIGAFGGTYIASGVKMGVAQITGSGTGDTSKRSGIVVFTDGEV
jgi:Mg-chelatase subunit ChlD